MTARKKAKKQAKRTRRTARRKRPDRASAALKAVAVGDVVRFPSDLRNQISRYDADVARGAHGSEAVEGIVCSIRKIATGKLVAKTRGPISGFVLEIIHHHTFTPHYASDRNTGGPRGPEDVRDNPTWARLRQVLHEMADRQQLISAASGGLVEEPLGPLLDGWRVVKVRADSVQSAL